MKIISWNINGLKSIIQNNDFIKTVEQLSADFICLQETKLNKPLNEFALEGYYQYYNYSKTAGYSGVAIYSKRKAENVIIGMPMVNDYEEIEDFDNESRVITLEFNDFFLVSVYVPAKSKTTRKNYRLEFDEIFYDYIEKLNNIKNVIICGDFNVCHKKYDISNRLQHAKVDIFSDEAVSSFNDILELGFIDTYRFLHPNLKEYTFWTNDIQNRNNTVWGWRLDYILVSEYLRDNIIEANILTKIMGSDHCPIELEIKE